MRRWLLGSVTALGFVALDPEIGSAAEPDPPAIVGGEPVEPCEWPSVVALRTGGLCTATLVDPRILVYAAHCGTLHSVALFGEDVDAPAREVPLIRCERFSDLFAVSSMDYAYCELAEPVTDVAITPILFGCETELIEIGTPVTIVGFGDTTSEGPQLLGLKHAATTQIVGLLGMIGIGGMGTGADSGDSGGPALVELADGSWRVLGVVSGGGGDGATVQYVSAPTTVAWIEERSGIDITPCHASDGSWAPTPECTGFFVDARASTSWADGCPSVVSPGSSSCGPAWIDPDDQTPPIVAWIEPVDGAVFGPGPIELDAIGQAQDADSGVREVRLLLDGVAWLDSLGQAAVDEVPPFEFADVAIADDGVHVLTLEAIDHSDNLASASVMIVIGEGNEDTGETGDDETGEGPEDGTDESDSTGAIDEPAGCQCTSAPSEPRPPLALWLSVALLGLRSRPRPRGPYPRRPGP